MIFNRKKINKEVITQSKKEFAQGVVWIAVIMAIIFLGAKYIGIENIQSKIGAAGIFGPLLFVLLKASTIVFAPLGGTPLYLVAAPLFGFTRGFAYIFLGDFFGSTIAFYISRIFGRRVMRKFLSKTGERAVDDILHHLEGWKGLAYTRIMFVGLPEVVAYATGLAAVEFWKYSLVNGIIYFIADAILVSFGEILLKSPVFSLVALTCLSLGGAVVGMKILKRKKKKLI